MSPNSNKIVAMAHSNIIETDSLCRDFVVGGEVVQALKNVTFAIGVGEFVSIMGTSGSGKSTLLNILGCLDTPSSGTYRIDGIDVATMDEDALSDLRNRKIGFVFQSYNLLPRTTALENVELPLFYNRKVSVRERRERAIEALKLVGLESRMQHTSAQLSGGQQQRVAIARAIVNNPVQELHAQGKTIAFVTHETDIASFTSRTIRLRDGMLVEDHPNTPLSAQQMVKSLTQ